MKTEMKDSVQVLDGDNCYVDVAVHDLEAISSDPARDLLPEHVSAIGELRNVRFYGLLSRAVRSGDSRTLRRTASVAVKLRMESLVKELEDCVVKLPQGLAKSRVLGAIVYLSESDRGKKRLLADDELVPFIVTNLLSVTDFDEKDFELGLAGLSMMVDNRSRLATNADAWTEVVADCINGLRGYVFTHGTMPQDLKQHAMEALGTLRKHPNFKRLDAESKRDLKQLEKA
jgi:hypothetical protein